MHNWSNKPYLETLRAHLENPETIVFEAGHETAKVTIDGRGRIQEVVASNSGAVSSSVISKPRHLVVGEGNTKRDVYHFLMPGGPMPTMRLGYTSHQGESTWSSLPHNFENNPEAGFEEVFFYCLNGATERAIQVGRGLWYDGTQVDAIWPVFNRTFGTVPMGYHPVVGEPGVHVSYVWVYLAKYSHWEKVKKV